MRRPSLEWIIPDNLSDMNGQPDSTEPISFAAIVTKSFQLISKSLMLKLVYRPLSW